MSRLHARRLAAVALLALAGGAGAAGQVPMHHGAQAQAHSPTEPGQGAFAAIAEIVALLEADPRTDWSRVDVDALHEHLVDMNLLMLEAHAAAQPIPGGLQIEVSAAGRAAQAVARMVPAHAAQLDRRAGWSASGRATPGGASMTVASSNPGDEAKIRALGFFGLMALEQHHQAHHYVMATGGNPHAH